MFWFGLGWFGLVCFIGLILLLVEAAAFPFPFLPPLIQPLLRLHCFRPAPPPGPPSNDYEDPGTSGSCNASESAIQITGIKGYEYIQCARHSFVCFWLSGAHCWAVLRPCPPPFDGRRNIPLVSTHAHTFTHARTHARIHTHTRTHTRASLSLSLSLLSLSLGCALAV